MDTTPAVDIVAAEEFSRLMKSAAYEFDRAIAGCLDGLSIPAWHVLAALKGGNGQPMSALGSVTLLPGPSLTRLVDRMVDDNLVLRKADAIDRRRVLVYQTRRGAVLYQRITGRLSKSGSIADLLTHNADFPARLSALLEQLRA